MGKIKRIELLNGLLTGWVNYFKHGTGYQKLKKRMPGYAAVCGTVSENNGSGKEPSTGVPTIGR